MPLAPVGAVHINETVAAVFGVLCIKVACICTKSQNVGEYTSLNNEVSLNSLNAAFL